MKRWAQAVTWRPDGVGHVRDELGFWKIESSPQNVNHWAALEAAAVAKSLSLLGLAMVISRDPATPTRTTIAKKHVYIIVS